MAKVHMIFNLAGKTPLEDHVRKENASLIKKRNLNMSNKQTD